LTDEPTSSPSARFTPEPKAQNPQALLKTFSPEELAQALAEQLAIPVHDWHRLSSNRAVRAREQAAAALVYMLKDQPNEAIPRLEQAVGWLNKTLKAPPCPTHGKNKS
jgi:hypothetical protein